MPRDQLGDRFPGRQIGTVGYQALSGPEALVAIVGYPPAELAARPGTKTVDRIATAPDVQGTTGLYRLAFELGAVIVLFPLLILINTATRLSAARREERFAAMRLVGATPRQVNAVASVESAVSALAGAVLGIGLFAAVRPAVADISFSGARFFERYMTPTGAGYLVVLAGVPLAATISALSSLRRVRLSPLGVSRKATPPRPRAWRLLPLVAGVILFVVPLLGGRRHFQSSANGSAAIPTVTGVLLILIGLVASGTWLTMQAARALARVSRGAPSLLAARRLADNPKGAFRTVGGLVLAVFVGSLLAAIVPVVNAAQTSLGGNARSLTAVLRVPYLVGPGLAPARAATPLGELRAQPGTVFMPVYANPRYDNGGPPPRPAAGGGASQRRRHHDPGLARLPVEQRLSPDSQYDSVVSCAGLTQFIAGEPALALPGPSYYVAMGLGLVVALGIVTSALPLLGRATQPNSARFE